MSGNTFGKGQFGKERAQVGDWFQLTNHLIHPFPVFRGQVVDLPFNALSIAFRFG